MLWTIVSYIGVFMAGGALGLFIGTACRAGGEYDRTMPGELAYRDVLAGVKP